MKRGTPRHPKTYALAEILHIPLPHAVGILEMLWHHAAIQTPRGDIGSLPDAAIAEAVCFKKPKQLIDALVSCRWLDRDDEYRLIIHDWPQHCEDSVKKWLTRNSKDVLTVYGQCPDNVQTDDGQNTDIVRHQPPGDAAKAMAKAVVVVNKKKKSTLLSEKQQVWFSEFWEAYWRRIGRGAAEDKFAEKVTSPELFSRIMQALALQSPWMMARDSDKRPYPATWLNQKRWEDDADVQQAVDSRTRDEVSRQQILLIGLDKRRNA